MRGKAVMSELDRRRSAAIKEGHRTRRNVLENNRARIIELRQQNYTVMELTREIYGNINTDQINTMQSFIDDLGKLNLSRRFG